MKKSCSTVLVALVVAGASLIASARPASAAPLHSTADRPSVQSDEGTPWQLSKEYEAEAATTGTLVPDPIRPWNVGWFYFNDKLYFWVVKPVAKGWRVILYPEFTRIGLRNFIHNLGFPGRFLNATLQGRLEQSGVETVCFLTDSTMGVLGFWNPAEQVFHLKPRPTNFDETLGHWGMGMGVFLTWPFWGPSSIRGTVGSLGDSVLDPIAHYWAVSSINWVNNVSLDGNGYETLRKSALDPYVAVRDAYTQNRLEKVSEK